MRFVALLLTSTVVGCSTAKLSPGDYTQGEQGGVTCRIPRSFTGAPPLEIKIWPTCDTTEDIHLEAYLVDTNEVVSLPARPQRLAKDQWNAVTRTLRFLPASTERIRVKFRARCLRYDGQSSSIRQTRATKTCVVP